LVHQEQLVKMVHQDPLDSKAIPDLTDHPVIPDNQEKQVRLAKMARKDQRDEME
uniref:Polyphosphate kinase 2 n=1 Tax=Gongylonema pulchrum TaxID=637853 RepID=A0A183DLG5_9BILA